MKHKKPATGLLVCLLLAGCVGAPTGPGVMVLPGSGRSFDEFRNDEYFCRRYALDQNGGASTQQAARESAVTTAAAGTAVGAVAGAAVGGQRGAAVGAGTGLLVGSVVGADAAQQSGRGTQRQYDNAYIQCMYAKGHRVPARVKVVVASVMQPPVEYCDRPNASL